MNRERAGHSLQATALVNEAYLRLVDYKRMQWQDRAHFFAVSAQLMRRILVERARRRNLKRGGGIQHIDLNDAALFKTIPDITAAGRRPQRAVPGRSAQGADRGDALLRWTQR